MPVWDFSPPRDPHLMKPSIMAGHGPHQTPGRRGRYGCQAQRIGEKGIAAQRFDGVEGGLARAPQPGMRFDQAAGHNAALARYGDARIDGLVDLMRHCLISDNPACAVRL